MRGRNKDGNEFPVEISLATWQTEGEVFICGIIRDISERERANIEERLHQSQNSRPSASWRAASPMISTTS